MAGLFSFASDTGTNQKLLKEIVLALQNIKGWGSVEIFVQNHKVTQITERNIKKTEHSINGQTKS